MNFILIKKFGILTVMVFALANQSFCQEDKENFAIETRVMDKNLNPIPVDTMATDTVKTEDVFFLAYLDSMMTATYMNHFCFSTDTSVLNYQNFEKNEIPEYSTKEMTERMAEIDRMTPIDLDYNKTVQSFINLYTNKRKMTTSRMLGMSQTYFPMFDQVFDEYDIPYELKYLAIVESALNPNAKSPAGAAGLWQFMNATGKYYGLEINSYIDERMDPYKSTHAACQYLSDLYDMYDDWQLALAAYNSGPGNVNKAIRRSGGKKTFWEIKEYLPRETQGYVPAFIAVTYAMNYASDHNIYPIEPDYTFFQLDTLRVCKQLRFDQIEKFTSLTVEELEMLNPCYTRGVLPATDGYNNLYLTVNCAGEFLVNEEKIYEYKKDVKPVFVEKQSNSTNSNSTEGKKQISYKVRSGDVLGVIADKHDVGLSQLKKWNGLKSNRIYPGQKLKIYVADDGDTAKNTTEKNVETTLDGNYQYHTVRKGDTLWDIAKLYDGVNYDQIKQLNSGINVKRLKQGQKIKIKKLS